MKLSALLLTIGIVLLLMCPAAYPTIAQGNTPTPTLAPGTIRTDEHGIAQVYVPAGCFLMGSDPAKDSAAESDEQPQHRVCLTQGYWLDAYEVTNAAYQQFIDADGYTTQVYWSEAGWLWKGSRTAPEDFRGFIDLQQPRVGVNWYEAAAYARWRGGRLPTEAEWEYAARGPESPIYPWGDTFAMRKANTAESVYPKTKPVGSYDAKGNWVGAYDLAGNVAEWVADWYGDAYYQASPPNDPAGVSSGEYRVLRGGGWYSNQIGARAANRIDGVPDLRFDFVGFRIVTPAH